MKKILILLIVLVLLVCFYLFYRYEPFDEPPPKTSVLVMNSNGDISAKPLLEAATGTGICRYITSSTFLFPSTINTGDNLLQIDKNISSNLVLNNLGAGRNLLITFMSTMPLTTQICNPVVTATLSSGDTVISSQKVDASSGIKKIIFDQIQTGSGGDCSLSITLNSSCTSAITSLPNAGASINVTEIQ